MQPSAAKDDFIRLVLSEGLYEVERDGTIVSKVRPKSRILRASLMDDGYCRVGLCRRGEVKYVKVHRLVAIALVPNPLNKPVVNHRDGNKANNHADNLEWVSDAENSQHALRAGLIVPLAGERCVASKLTAEEVREIRQLYSSGTLSQEAIGLQFGVRQNTVSYIVNQVNWRGL